MTHQLATAFVEILGELDDEIVTAGQAVSTLNLLITAMENVDQEIVTDTTLEDVIEHCYERLANDLGTFS